MNILAIESSADETAAAVVKNGVIILSNVVASSARMHAKYGGIVPEVAARAHVQNIIPVIKQSLDDAFGREKNHSTLNNNKSSGKAYYYSLIKSQIDAIAVTVGPGLIGSLLVGVETARAIAAACDKPIIPVNHVLAHMYANFVGYHPPTNCQPTKNAEHEPKTDSSVSFPAISLVVSGGHTELYLMSSIQKITWIGGTLDDAAGECLDKTARLLGLDGGAAIEKKARNFQPSSQCTTLKLPRPKINDKDFNFSFSGLKTAVLREKNAREAKRQWNQEAIGQFACEIQDAITEVLVAKTLKAFSLHGAKSILLSGGVAANIRLREKFKSKLQTLNQAPSLHVPPPWLCTDNAVYIASYAYFRATPAHWKQILAQPDLSVQI